MSRFPSEPFHFNSPVMVALTFRPNVLTIFKIVVISKFCTVNRGVHAGFENLSDMYPIQNRKVFDRLQGLCSQMAHWAPILAEVTTDFLCIFYV